MDLGFLVLFLDGFDSGCLVGLSGFDSGLKCFEVVLNQTSTFLGMTRSFKAKLGSSQRGHRSNDPLPDSSVCGRLSHGFLGFFQKS